MKTSIISNFSSFVILFLSASFFLNHVEAQQIIDPEPISIGEGLSSSAVKEIIQDSYGLIWAGTEDGLNLYDGYNFETYKNIPGEPTSLLDSDVWGLIEDFDKNMWIAVESGVSRFVRDKNEFINYDFTEIFELSGGQERTFELLLDSNNRLWASSPGGVLFYDRVNDSWKHATYSIVDTNRTSWKDLSIAVTQDNSGKVWLGSYENGLMENKNNDTIFYPASIKINPDGVDFTAQGNFITYIYADPTNVLWITTRNGIYKYYPDRAEIKVLREYNYAKFRLYNHWNCIVQDESGNVWIGNNFRGVLKFDGISDDFEEIELAGHVNIKNFGLDISITNIMFDRTGILWITTIEAGILKYDPTKEPFTVFTHDEVDKRSISGNQIFTLFESQVHKNKIFVGTRGTGLNLFDQNSKTFSEIKFFSQNAQFGPSVRSIAEDEDGSLWLGTWGEGIIQMNSQYQEIKRYSNDKFSSNSLSDNSVRVIKKDRNGIYWIGTNSGLNLLNPVTQTIRTFGSQETRRYPQELVEISRDKLNNSNTKFNIEKVGNYENRKMDFNVIKPRNYLVISAGEGTSGSMYDYGWIENSTNDTIWSAREESISYHCGGGNKNRLFIDLINLKPGNYSLNYISDDSHSFDDWNVDEPIHLQFWGIKVVEIDDEILASQIQGYLSQEKDRQFIKGNNIRSIHISDNIVWIGTDAQGLNKIDQEKNSVTVYSHDDKVKNSLSNNSVQYIHEDEKGILWLATNAGLNKFDPVKETFEVYTGDDGLPTNYISSILPGEDGGLWISTRSGISKMVVDQETNQVTFVNYDTEDGIGGMGFTAQVALKSRNGEYYFGGDQGLVSFKPTRSNNAVPKLIFSDLKISNKSIRSMPFEDRPTTSSIFDLTELTLPYNKNDLTFEFAALHYSNPAKNQYAHKLDGYNDEWIFNNKREVSYTNLDPGEYTFSIKGSNRDGVWSSQEKSIRFTINPPWWFTTFAYIGYGFIFIGIIFAVDRIQRRRLIIKAREKLRIQNAEHRAEAAELQAKATESERRALQAEFEQKKKELEEARQLQLSMLPKELPQLPNLDIAVYMKTATEVGGDYYDFHIGIDGALTVVLGDATGHGMKAGTMVTTTKSLFNVLAPNPNIVETFHEMTRCLRLMQLEKLSMCMTMMKIVGNKIQMSAAGMPPVYIYKRESQSIEEHLIKGMPLGTFTDFPYSLVESNLSSGDTILMMSDGFPELMNSNKEMFGYKKTRNLFEEVAGESPEDIISKLTSAGTDWVNEADPDDDVTFVVIKVK